MPSNHAVEIRAEIHELKDGKDGVWDKAAGPLCSAIIGAVVSYCIFVRNAGKKDRIAHDRELRQRAVELLTEFIAGEFYLRARLITQEYLLEGGSKFSLSLDGKRKRNLVEMGTYLATLGDSEDREARFYIRAILSFFWLVDQAHSTGLISNDETLFDHHYTWYWIHIIEHRLDGCEDGRMFRKLDWMVKPLIEAAIRKEYSDLLLKLGVLARPET